MNTDLLRKIVDEINIEAPNSITYQEMVGFKIWNAEKEMDIVEPFLKQNDSSLMMCRVNKIYHQWRKWTEFFPQIKPYYAVKANPGETIVRLLAKLGTNFDCATPAEYDMVLKMGVSPDRIIYAHPIKHVNYLRDCKQKGINFTVVDSLEEVEKIQEHFPEMEYLIRLKIGNQKAQIKLSDKFGATIEGAKAIVDKSIENKMNLKGICFHVGYYNTDITIYSSSLKFAREVYDYALSKGLEMSVIDLGGGFISFDSEEYRFEDCAKNINASLKELFAKELEEKKLSIIAEPGTYFVDNSFNAYYLCTKVFMEAEVEGGEPVQKVYLNDGFYGTLSNYFEDYSDLELSCIDILEENPKKIKTRLYGPSFDSEDIKKSLIDFPYLEEGFILMAEFVGAYSVALVSEYFTLGKPLVKYYFTEIPKKK